MQAMQYGSLFSLFNLKIEPISNNWHFADNWKTSGKNIKKGFKKDITIQNPCLKWNALEKVFSDPEFLRKKSEKEVLNIFVSDVF